MKKLNDGGGARKEREKQKGQLRTRSHPVAAATREEMEEKTRTLSLNEKGPCPRHWSSLQVRLLLTQENINPGEEQQKSHCCRTPSAQL